MMYERRPADSYLHAFNGFDVEGGELKRRATGIDLTIGNHGELRAIAEVCACDYAKGKFLKDFIETWDKVMKLDRFYIRTKL